ncbi:IS66 family insertion sequence element accessory protein TnpB [Patescibacteria group bacterium]|nr:IS66 family insertion sequence element accessory protein TnpB [Patescibacteria group bacterium]
MATRDSKKEEMFLLVGQWKASGLSQAAFAEQNNLKLVKFRYWIKKYRDDQDGSGFIQITRAFGHEINLRYPNGVELVLPGSTPLCTLKSLINF